MCLEEVNLERIDQLWQEIKAHGQKMEAEYPNFYTWKQDEPPRCWHQDREKGQKLWKEFLGLEDKLAQCLLGNLYVWHKDAFKEEIRAALEADRLEVLIFDVLGSGVPMCDHQVPKSQCTECSWPAKTPEEIWEEDFPYSRWDVAPNGHRYLREEVTYPRASVLYKLK